MRYILIFLLLSSFASFAQPKPEVKQDTIKLELDSDVLQLLQEAGKKSEELQKNPQWVAINAQLQSLQAEQIGLITGYQKGRGVKGKIIGLKDGKLLIIPK